MGGVPPVRRLSDSGDFRNITSKICRIGQSFIIVSCTYRNDVDSSHESFFWSSDLLQFVTVSDSTAMRCIHPPQKIHIYLIIFLILIPSTSTPISPRILEINTWCFWGRSHLPFLRSLLRCPWIRGGMKCPQSEVYKMTNCEYWVGIGICRFIGINVSHFLECNEMGLKYW